jgi:hypothetical protein
MPPVGTASPPPPGGSGGGGGGDEPPAAAGPAPSGPSPHRLALLAAGAALLVLLGAGVAIWTSNQGDDDPTDPNTLGTSLPTVTASASPEPSEEPTEPDDHHNPPGDPGDSGDSRDQQVGDQGGRQNPPPQNDENPAQLPPGCTDQIRSNPRWVCMTSAVIQSDGSLVIQYEADWNGDTPNINNGYHLHIYGFDGEWPPEVMMGHQSPDIGSWVIKDANPAVLSASEVTQVIGDRPQVCARIADSRHWLVEDNNGGYTTGNCIAIQR